MLGAPSFEPFPCSFRRTWGHSVGISVTNKTIFGFVTKVGSHSPIHGHKGKKIWLIWLSQPWDRMGTVLQYQFSDTMVDQLGRNPTGDELTGRFLEQCGSRCGTHHSLAWAMIYDDLWWSMMIYDDLVILGPVIAKCEVNHSVFLCTSHHSREVPWDRTASWKLRT